MTWYLHKSHRGKYWGSVAYVGVPYDDVDRRAAELSRDHGRDGWRYRLDGRLEIGQRVRQTFFKR